MGSYICLMFEKVSYIIILSVSYFKNIKFTFPPKFVVFTLYGTGNTVLLGRQIHVININVIITFIGYLYTNNETFT